MTDLMNRPGSAGWLRSHPARVPAAAVVLGLALTVLALTGASSVDPPVDSDLGLAAVLPVTYWIGLLGLSLLLVVVLLGPRRRPRVAGPLLALLVLVAYGAPAFVSTHPRGEPAWRHLGIARTLVDQGRVDPDVDAYFGWPGFFAALGTLAREAGVSMEHLALVAPVLNGLLWALAILVIARRVTDDPRHQWLTVWVFVLANWIDQDYLSPQAFVYFLFLVAVGLLLGPLAARPRLALRAAVAERGLPGGVLAWWVSREPVEPRAGRRVAALVAVVVLGCVITPSHQLTPFLLLLAVCALTVTGRLWTPGLVVPLTALVALWLLLGASGYLVNHPVLLQGSAEASAGANLADRLVGSSGHLAVVLARVALTGLVLGLAGLGALRLRRAGRLDPRLVVLAGAPFLAVPVQSYGGEMLMRATLFALPFVSYLAAAMLLPRPDARAIGPAGRRGVWALAGVLAVLLAGLLVVGRYGNARFDVFTEDEIAGTQALYDVAPPHADLVAGPHPVPWRFEAYTDHRYLTLTEVCDLQLPITDCIGALTARAYRSEGGLVVMITRASIESLRIHRASLTPDPLGYLDTWLAADAHARLAYANPDVRIYVYTPGSTP